ncbi:hypothetical protein ACH5RR_000970 [Cinchona calisaya]|uniref:Thioredoxin domain-containing protein n=1 Tax=Cinchona calisaya TaxID=153742 RepID=A0ABD3B389_9GENT
MAIKSNSDFLISSFSHSIVLGQMIDKGKSSEEEQDEALSFLEEYAHCQTTSSKPAIPIIGCFFRGRQIQIALFPRWRYEMDTMVLKEPGFVVEFYASWCGHCQVLVPEYAVAVAVAVAATKLKEEESDLGQNKIMKMYDKDFYCLLQF